MLRWLRWLAGSPAVPSETDLARWQRVMTAAEDRWQEISPAEIAERRRIYLDMVERIRPHLATAATRQGCAVHTDASGRPAQHCPCDRPAQRDPLPAAIEWNRAVVHSHAHPTHVLGPYEGDDGLVHMDCCQCTFDSAKF